MFENFEPSKVTAKRQPKQKVHQNTKEYGRDWYRAATLNCDLSDMNAAVANMVFSDKPKAYLELVKYEQLLKDLFAIGIESRDQLFETLTAKKD